MTKARDLGDNALNTKPKVVDAKGDLIVGTAADTADRLAVGSNGDSLVADSTATTGLRWQSNFAAGKNVILNSDFRIAQRGTSFSMATDQYNLDRWYQKAYAAYPTGTVSQQTFTPGTAPVAGYEGANFMRANVTAHNNCQGYFLQQKIEDVRTFAGQTVTLSFWAKADAAASGVNVYAFQGFGTGGSAEVTITVKTGESVTSSWQRYSYTFSVPSISGKTIGTSSNLMIDIRLPISGSFIRVGSFDLWGVQLEAGNTATAFQTATGTVEGELAACQRYYEVGSVWREGTNANNGSYCVFSNSFLVQKRANATMTFGNVADANANITSIDGPEAIYSSISPFSKNNLQTGFAFRFIPSSTTSTLRQYWTASAEL
jgi:hypothetical protein